MIELSVRYGPCERAECITVYKICADKEFL
jgi:hypothetical protein